MTAVVVVLHGFVFQSKVSSQHPDVLGFWLPTYCFLGKTLAAGHLPEWNPHVMGGIPFAADPQSGWMYAPAMLLFTTLPCGAAIRLLIALQPALGGIALYGFLRSERLSRPAATVGGLALALGLAASRLALFLPFPSAFAWTAVLLWCCSRTLNARTGSSRIRWVLLAAIAWGQLAGAYFSHGLILGTAAAIAFMGARLWSEVRAGTRRGMEALALAGLLAVAFAGVNLAVLLPRLVYTPETSYERVLSGAARVGSAPNPTWPLKLAVSSGGYVGVAVLILAPAALWSRRHRALAFAFAVFGALAYVFGVDGVAPSLARAVQGVPVLDFYAHFPGRFSLGLFLTLPVLGAIGVDAWMERRAWPERALMAAPGILLFLALPAALGAGWLRLIIPALGALAGGGVLLVIAGRPGLAAVLPGVLALELIAGALLGQGSGLLGVGRAHRDNLFGATTSGWFGPLARPDVDANAYLRPGPIARALERSEDRYMSLDPAEASPRGYLTLQDPGHWGLMANQRAMLFGLQDAQGYNPVQLERYWAYVRAVTHGPLAYNASFFDRPTAAMLNLLQVNSVVTGEGDGPEGWSKVSREGRWVLYRTRDPSPLFSVLTRRQVVAGPRASLRAVGAPGFDPSSTIVLEEDPTRLFGGVPNRRGGVGGRFRSKRPQSETLIVDAPEEAVVLVRIPYARNWHATVDGLPVRILPADHFLMGVPVRPGSHTIRLRYDDPWIGYGMLGSLLAVLALLVSALLTRRGGAAPRAAEDMSPLSVARSG